MRQRAESIIEGHRRAVDLALHGGTISAVLDTLLRIVQRELRAGVIASIEVEGARSLTAVPANDPPESFARPIVSSLGQFLGTLVLSSQLPFSPTARELELVELVLGTAALLLERDHEARERQVAERALADAEDSLATQAACLRRMHALALRLGGEFALRPRLQAIVAAAAESFATCRATLAIVDPVEGTLGIVASVGFTGEVLDELEPSLLSVGAAGRAFARGRAVMVADTELDASESFRSAGRFAHFRGVQATPITSHAGQVVGVLAVYFDLPRQVTESELQIADICALLAADAIEVPRT